MSKSVIELLNEVRASEELQKEAADVLQKKDNQAMIDFLRRHDCDASLSEAKKALQEESERLKEGGELTPEELEAAAGGTGIWIFLAPVLATLATGAVTGGLLGASSCESSSSAQTNSSSSDDGC